MARISNWKKGFESTQKRRGIFEYNHTFNKDISVQAVQFSQSMIVDGFGRDGESGWIVFGLVDKGDRNDIFFRQVVKTKAEAMKVSLKVREKFNSQQLINKGIKNLKVKNKPKKYVSSDFEVVSGRSTDRRIKYLILSKDKKVHVNFFDGPDVDNNRLRGTFHSPKDREFFNADVSVKASKLELIQATVREVNKLIK